MATHKKHKMNPNSLKNLEKGKIKKGEVRNPRGGAANLNRLPALKRFTKVEVAAVFTELLNRTVDELEAIATDKQETILRGVVARALIRDKSKGDFVNTGRILDRILGRSDQPLNVNGNMVNTDVTLDLTRLDNKGAEKLYALLSEAGADEKTGS